MSERYLFNESHELVPSEDGLELRLPQTGTRLSVTRYQLGLLQQFITPLSLSAMLERFPYDREETTKFFDRAIREQVLLPVGPEGQPLPPDTMVPRPTVFGTPRFDPETPPAFVFLGVPFDRNTSGRAGTKLGPAAMRSVSEAARYQLDPHRLEPVGIYDYGRGRTMLKGVTLADAGDIVFNLGEPPETAYRRISDVVGALAESGAIPMIMGGDHSITYPIVRALPAERFGIIHFDAHTDLGETKTVGLHHGNVFSVVLEKLEYVERLVQIGLRGIIEANAHTQDPRVDAFGMDRVRREGLAAILASLPEDLPYYLSIDIDVVDPAFAPSTGTPLAGGLFPHELKDLVHELAKRRTILGCDIVEVGPELGPSDSTAGLAIEVLLSAADGIVCGLAERLDRLDGGEHG